MTSSHPLARPVPVVLPARRRPRPPVRPPARPPVPRGRPGPGPADRHQLDPGGQAQRPVSSPATPPSRPPARGPTASPRRLADRGGQAAAQGGHAADPRPGRHPDEAVRAARPGGRRPSQPDPRPGRLALRLRPRLRRPRRCSSPTRRGASIALPLLARLYVRKKDLPGIDPKHRPAFRTKLELAVELLRWAKPWLGLLELADLGGGRRGLCQGGRSSSRRRPWG